MARYLSDLKIYSSFYDTLDTIHHIHSIHRTVMWLYRYSRAINTDFLSAITISKRPTYLRLTRYRFLENKYRSVTN